MPIFANNLIVSMDWRLAINPGTKPNTGRKSFFSVGLFLKIHDRQGVLLGMIVVMAPFNPSIPP
jgi:hypothetical protein